MRILHGLAQTQRHLYGTQYWTVERDNNPPDESGLTAGELQRLFLSLKRPLDLTMLFRSASQGDPDDIEGQELLKKRDPNVGFPADRGTYLEKMTIIGN